VIPLPPPFRAARPGDGPALAALMNAAGEGIPLSVWSAMAGPGGDPWALGAGRLEARAAERGGIVVADEGAGPVAALIGNPIGPAPERPGPDAPARFAPLMELEAEAAESWYVNALAALPEHRGRGFGTRLLGVAEAIAAEAGLGRLSLIVSSANAGARRLYARLGFHETARRPKAGPDAADGADWILMLRDLPAARR
jgi:ribosomal protein S18 acetylase RimI-like enzyme